MNKEKCGFRVYFPDDAEGPEDAHDLTCYPWVRVYDPDDAAELACEYDYSERDGWERDMSGGATRHFPMVIISPEGTETRYFGWHEPSIEHKTSRDDGDENRQRVQDGEGSRRQDEACSGQEGADGQARCLHPTES